jgi:hypothetical protein
MRRAPTVATAERTRRPRTLRVAAKDLQPGDQLYSDDGEVSRIVRFAERGDDQVQAEIEGPGPRGIVFPQPEEEVAVLQKDRGKITPLPGTTAGVVIANVPTAALEAWRPEQLAHVRELVDFVRHADAVLIKAAPGARDTAMTELQDKYGFIDSWIVPVQPWEPGGDDVIPPFDGADPLVAPPSDAREGADDEITVAQAAEMLGDVVEKIVTDALDEPEKPEHGKDPVDEGRGRLAFDTGDEPTISNTVLGPRPSKASLVIAKPKPLPVKQDFQPGEQILLLLWCAIGPVKTGGETREHDTTPLETLMWENPHIAPGKALEELRSLDTREALTRRIIDHAVHIIEKLRDTNAYESDVDFLTDLRDRLYAHYHLSEDPPRPATTATDGVVDVSFDGRDPEDADGFYDVAAERVQADLRDAGHDVTVTMGPAGKRVDVDQQTADALGTAVETSSFTDDGPPKRVEPRQDAESLTRRWEGLQQRIDDADPGSEALLAYSEEAEMVRQQIIAAGGLDPESAEAYEQRESRAATQAARGTVDEDVIVDAVVVDEPPPVPEYVADEVDTW